MSNTQSMESIVLAIADPTCHAEATYIAAATGRPIIDVLAGEGSLESWYHRAYAIFADREGAAECGLDAGAPRDRVFAVAPDPGPPPDIPGATAGFCLPAQALELLRALVVAPTRTADRRAPVIAIYGATGGVGASTLAAAVALSVPGAVLIDATVTSGGLDLLMGAEDSTGARWADVGGTEGHVDAHAVLGALPHAPGGTPMLTVARTATATPGLVSVAGDGGKRAEHLIGAVRSAVPAVVVDAGDTDALGAIIASADYHVILHAAEIRSTAQATNLAARLRAAGAQPVSILRHRQWSALSAADATAVTGMDVIAEIPHIRGLAKATELGALSKVPGKLKPVVGAIVQAAEVRP
ncbi:hypothetical protein [Corynebacterium renale]|uniref:hypothetical protein n=1 Tax=Corynebacterium renale TaxID=1724 RepID=UPI000E1BF55F|nr:hypothetical protein [Corynebacterium renale]